MRVPLAEIALPSSVNPALAMPSPSKTSDQLFLISHTRDTLSSF